MDSGQVGEPSNVDIVFNLCIFWPVALSHIAVFNCDVGCQAIKYCCVQLRRRVSCYYILLCSIASWGVALSRMAVFNCDVGCRAIKYGCVQLRLGMLCYHV